MARAAARKPPPIPPLRWPTSGAHPGDRRWRRCHRRSCLASLSHPSRIWFQVTRHRGTANAKPVDRRDRRAPPAQYRAGALTAPPNTIIHIVLCSNAEPSWVSCIAARPVREYGGDPETVGPSRCRRDGGSADEYRPRATRTAPQVPQLPTQRSKSSRPQQLSSGGSSTDLRTCPSTFYTMRRQRPARWAGLLAESLALQWFTLIMHPDAPKEAGETLGEIFWIQRVGLGGVSPGIHSHRQREPA
jgi:hypothetical protein